ncbi:ABC transporter permease [Kribbella catacumbae]|uniref:ABC transporter permease n=1 Tax=Kribbella catacumbae TaxID=460086 RepID=UPI00036044C4|nr:ABC transporter permease [Kribbella catacumbae]
MTPALVTELIKLARGTVPRATTAILVLGVSLICSSMLLATNTGDPQIAAKLGALIDPGGWAGYLTIAAQVTAAAGLLGCGVVLSWMFGREFGDGTITGLFAIPVSRPTIAAAKLLVYLAWLLFCSAALLAALLVFGLAFGLGPIPADVLPALGRQFVLAVLTGVIAMPVAWAATIGRSILAGIAVAVGILVLSQIAAIAGAGQWFPFSVPALWAISTDVPSTHLTLVIPVVLASAGLAMLSWRRLQLN